MHNGKAGSICVGGVHGGVEGGGYNSLGEVHKVNTDYKRGYLCLFLMIKC